jgi:hypothetical protein
MQGVHDHVGVLPNHYVSTTPMLVIDPKEFMIMLVCYQTYWVIHLKLYSLLCLLCK